MIRVKWLHKEAILSGDKGLIDEWRQAGEGVVWVDLDGDVPDENELLAGFGCHELAIQDALRLRHPPKCEDFGDHTFVLYRGFSAFDEGIDVTHVQVAFFIGRDFLITRHNGDAFGVKSLWSNDAETLLWLSSPAILFTRIINRSLKGYIESMLDLESDIYDLEDSMLNQPTDALMQTLVLYRSRLRKLNRVFRYHEKIFGEIIRESTYVLSMEDESLYHATQDVYDKCERLLSLGTLFYEQCGDLVDGYLSITSHQLNKTMQVLTVITAIFVPLGLLSGIYGMNFQYIPELQYRYGYFILLGAMCLIGIGLLFFFRSRRWL